MPDASSLVDRLNAALTGRYVVERELGEGGMATVYAAQDVRHDRKVAIKVLRPELVAVIGAERFLAEIRTTAHLQHPHILPLFDSGEADTFLFYVMPLLEGDSLQERIGREHQLPVDEAVRIARAVASALDYAHRNGVIHRDIKPANILLQDGEPVIADFGIALAVSAAGGGRLTETGLSLGTPSYMSPEQATAEHDPGPGSDVYSLGCVLYEMLTGEPPFTGASAQAILGKIVLGNPPLVTEHRPTVPAHVEAVVLRALEKIPADRYAAAGDFAAALDDVTATHPRQAVAGGRGVAPRRWISQRASQVVLATLVLVLGWASYATFGPTKVSEGAAVQVPFRLPRDFLGIDGADLSPDGSRLVWALPDTGAPAGKTPTYRLWTRRWSEPGLTVIPGTEGAYGPSFSPDGTHVTFLANGDLKSVALDGSRPVTLLAGAGFSSLDWGPDGFIYGSYLSTDRPSLWRVPEAGGKAEKVGGPEGGHMDLEPFALPNGRGILFTSHLSGISSPNDSVGVLDLSTGDEHRIAAGGSARFVLPGYLVYGTVSGQLMAAPFDTKRLEITGAPQVIADNVLAFFTSEAGDLLYIEGRVADRTPEVVWLGPDSSEKAVDWPMRPGPLPVAPRLSPDGSRLALVVLNDTTEHLFVGDLGSGFATPVLGDADEQRPAWSATGRDIVFLSRREDGTWRFWRRRADASGKPVALSASLGGDPLKYSLGFWSPDQPVVMGTDSGLVVLRLGKDSLPVPLLDSGSPIRTPTLSPDGRWVAFVADVSDGSHIFVRPFPGVDSARISVSATGGDSCPRGGCEDRDPRWSPDGRTLYYTSAVPGGVDLVAAHVRTTPGFSVVSKEHVAPLERGYTWYPNGWLYDVAPDGRVVDVRWGASKPTVGGAVFVKNFRAQLREKLGGEKQ